MKHKTYTKEMIKSVVISSHSILEALEKLELKDNGGNRNTFKRKIKEFDIPIDHFTGKQHFLGKTSVRKISHQEYIKCFIYFLTS